MLKVDLADTLGTQAVGQSPRDLFGFEGNDVAGAQAGLGIGREFGLDSDYFDRWLTELESGSDTADESSATDGAQDGLNLGQLFEDFETCRPLAGNDVFIVVGRNDSISVLGREFLGPEAALLASGANFDDFSAKRCRRIEFVLRGVARHHDDGLHAKSTGGISDSLCVIPAGIGDDAAAPRLVAQRRNLVVGPAQLEGADGLQVLEFQVELAGVGGLGPLKQRRPDSDPVEAGVGGAYIVERDDVRSPKSPA